MASDAININIRIPIPPNLPPGSYSVANGVWRDSKGNLYTYDGPAPVYDNSGDRFGRVLKSFKYLGELRRQKNAPHTEVFYTWVNSPKENSMVLRSVNNCSNDQLTESIRVCGRMIESHMVLREDGETVLDLLYSELGKRANAGPKQD